MPLSFQTRVLELVGSMYDIAQQSSAEAWSAAYAEMADLLGCGPGGIWLIFPQVKRIEFVCHDLDLNGLREYDEKFAAISPFSGRIMKLRPGEVFERAAEMSDEEWEQTPFYTEYLKRYDVYNYRHEALFRTGDAIVGVTFTRRKADPRFTDDHIRTIEFLNPHIERAFGLYADFLAMQREVKVLAHAFDRIPQCVLIVGSDNKMVFANHSGREMLERRDGLELARDGRLRASSGESRMLRQLLSQVLDGDGTRGAAHETRLQIERPSGLRPLELTIAPFRAEHLLSDGPDNLAIVYISDPDQRGEMVEQTLGHIHGLTPAETRVAALLADGHPLSEICGLLNIKPNTARTHLKQIFSKTGTSRQSELVKLILTGSANLRPAK